MWQKLKSWLTDDGAFYGLLFILTSATSFGLGRWSVADTAYQKPSVVVTAPTPTPVVDETQISTSTTAVSAPVPQSEVVVVGSKSGTKYHLPTCPGAKQIKLENMISFASTAAAEAAGYTPAANCPGLQ